MTTNKKTQQPLAILKLPTQVELLVTYAENVVARMTGNPFQPERTPLIGRDSPPPKRRCPAPW